MLQTVIGFRSQHGKEKILISDYDSRIVFDSEVESDVSVQFPVLGSKRKLADLDSDSDGSVGAENVLRD